MWNTLLFHHRTPSPEELHMSPGDMILELSLAQLYILPALNDLVDSRRQQLL